MSTAHTTSIYKIIYVYVAVQRRITWSSFISRISLENVVYKLNYDTPANSIYVSGKII